MNKQDYEKTIEALDNAKEQITKIYEEEKQSYKRWRAKKDDEGYYYIDSLGTIQYKYEHYSNTDNYRYLVGNYYKTREEAEEAREKQIIRQELQDLADELNQENPVDWNDFNQLKFFICNDFGDNPLYRNWNKTSNYQGVIYCTNKEFLDIAKERIGENRLLKLFYIKKEL